MRITVARTSFQPGPFHLGRLSLVVGWAATFWVAFITVIFCLPTAYPGKQHSILQLALTCWVLVGAQTSGMCGTGTLPCL